MFGGHSADIFPTCVRYLSRDICPLYILLRFPAVEKVLQPGSRLRAAAPPLSNDHYAAPKKCFGNTPF